MNFISLENQSLSDKCRRIRMIRIQNLALPSNNLTEFFKELH